MCGGAGITAWQTSRHRWRRCPAYSRARRGGSGHSVLSVWMAMPKGTLCPSASARSPSPPVSLRVKVTVHTPPLFSPSALASALPSLFHAPRRHGRRAARRPCRLRRSSTEVIGVVAVSHVRVRDVLLLVLVRTRHRAHVGVAGRPAAACAAIGTLGPTSMTAALTVCLDPSPRAARRRRHRRGLEGQADVEVVLVVGALHRDGKFIVFGAPTGSSSFPASRFMSKLRPFFSSWQPTQLSPLLRPVRPLWSDFFMIHSIGVTPAWNTWMSRFGTFAQSGRHVRKVLPSAAMRTVRQTSGSGSSCLLCWGANAQTITKGNGDKLLINHGVIHVRSYAGECHRVSGDNQRSLINLRQ